jgi:hypothetical protein
MNQNLRLNRLMKHWLVFKFKHLCDTIVIFKGIEQSFKRKRLFLR